jgi:hypothetical protein
MTRSGHGEKLSRTQEQAIQALLTERTLEGAAAKAGIGRSTLRRWLREPGFRARYDQARADVLADATKELAAVSLAAVRALERNLTSGIPNVEVGAAKAILDLATKAQLEDLESRLTALEARQQEGDQSWRPRFAT